MYDPDQPIWDHYRCGRSTRQIGRELGVSYMYVQRRLRRHGGIRPAVRCRAKSHLSFAEREEISRGIAAGVSANSIAVTLGRSPSTISREIARNGGREGYRAVDADQAAWERARRPKATKLAENSCLRQQVVDGLEKKWSPEQISGRLVVDFPDDSTHQISIETIYRAIYLPGRSNLPTGVSLPLRTRRRLRKSKAHRGGKRQKRGQIKEITLITERPDAVRDRTVAGHWEGDLVLGIKTSGVATLVERTSRYTEIVKVGGLTSPPVVDAVSARLQQIPPSMCLSLTWDQGKEMAQHQRLSDETAVPLYFCHPRSPWERATNENTNGLLRQYFPKRVVDFSDYDQAELDLVSAELNGRPRKILGFRTPAEVYAEALTAKR